MYFCHILRYDIEQIIGHIKTQPNAWVNARYYISNSNSQYLLFAAVTIYEEMIKNGKWDAIAIEDQTDIRNLLLEFLLAKNRVCTIRVMACVGPINTNTTQVYHPIHVPNTSHR